MSRPTVQSLDELEAQLRLNRGWWIFQLQCVDPDRGDQASLFIEMCAFESARLTLEDRLPVSLVHGHLSPEEVRLAPLATTLPADLSSQMFVFRDGRLIESLPAHTSATPTIEWIEFLYSLHETDFPRRERAHEDISDGVSE